MSYSSDNAPTIPAKFAGKCACGARVAVNAPIRYVRGQGVVGCAACGNVDTANVRAPSGAGPGQSAQQAAAVTLRGTVRSVRSRRDGWAAISLAPALPLPEGAPRLTRATVDAAGAIPEDCCVVGTEVQITGVWEQSPQWGWQFKAATASAVVEASDAGVLAFLDRLPGIGKARGEAVLRMFGRARTLEILEAGGAELAKVSGITPELAAQIAEAYLESRELRDVLIYLGGLGLGPGQTSAVLRAWGADARRNIEEDPYRLTAVEGFGFLRADEVAKRAGIAPDDPRRCTAAALHVLEAAVDEGHCYSSPEVIAGEGHERDRTVQAARKTGVPGELLRRGTVALLAPREEVRKGRRVTLPPYAVAETSASDVRIFTARLLDAEQSVARHLARLCAEVEGGAPLAVPAGACDGLHEHQVRAVELAATAGVLVITGGPGTGKTTTAKRVLSVLSRRADGQQAHVVCAAPTGKAALRLQQQTGVAAYTIHRLLEWSPRTRGFQRNDGNPLPADVVLCDESSMIDIELAASLLAAVPSGAHLVIIGDVDQLPSVGPGTVLRDIIESGTVAVVRLTHIFRQAADSGIPWLAHEINEARAPDFSRYGRDVAFLAEADAESAADAVVDLVTSRIPASYGIAPQDVQVLSPQHDGPLGVRSLNTVLQRCLRPIDLERDLYVKVGAEGLVAEGDKIIQIRNDYELLIRNGEGARALAVHPKGINVELLSEELGEEIRTSADTEREEYEGEHERERRRSRTPDPIVLVADFGTAENRRLVGFTRSECYDVQLAYAITVHKSQGSQFPAVVMPAHTSQKFMLTRALAYTGITRAEKMVAIVGERDVLASAARNVRDKNRRTGLSMRLPAALATARLAVTNTRAFNARVARAAAVASRGEEDEGGADVEEDEPVCVVCDAPFARDETPKMLPAGDPAHPACAAKIHAELAGEPAPPLELHEAVGMAIMLDVISASNASEAAPTADEVRTQLAQWVGVDATCLPDEHVFDVEGAPCSACGAAPPAGLPLSRVELARLAAMPLPSDTDTALMHREAEAEPSGPSLDDLAAQYVTAPGWREELAQPWDDSKPTRPEPAAAAPVENVAATHCAICGIRLEDGRSIERGIGPKCWRRLGLADDRNAADEPAALDVLAPYPEDRERVRVKLAGGDDPVRATANALIYQLSLLYSQRRTAPYSTLRTQRNERAAALCRALAALGFRVVALRIGSRMKARVFAAGAARSGR